MSSPDRRPLKRAEVVLRSTEPGRTALGVTTDENGRFAFINVADGKYVLNVSREGYVSSTAVYQDNTRLTDPFEVRRDLNLNVRLLPAATISGKVCYSDGEPAAALSVIAYREYYERRRHSYEVAARAMTDDRGEYRLYGLPPGRYYVSAIFVPFSGRDDVREELVRDAYGQLVTPERTVTTFLPSSWKLNEATQLVLHTGSDVGTADIFLAQSRTATIRGRLLSGKDGRPPAGASLLLLREDGSGDGYIPYPGAARIMDKGEFEFRGVVPGRYALEARASDQKGSLFARQPLVVGNAPEVNTNVVLQGDIEVRGIFMPATNGGKVPARLQIVAEPRGSGATHHAMAGDDGAFSLRVTAGETYDLYLQKPPGNLYLAGARADTTDVLRPGLRLDTAGNTTLILTVAETGGEVLGETKPGAKVALVPQEPILARYSETAANEWGLFAFGALSPGEYRLIAWFDDPPCDIWAPATQNECSRFGLPVHVKESGSYTYFIEP